MDYTSIEWERAALLVIDMQNDFIDGATPVAGTAETLPRVAEVVDLFRAAGRPVAHVIRLYVPGSSDTDPVRRAGIELGMRIAAPGSHGAAIPPELTGGQTVELDSDALLTGAPQHVRGDEAIFFKPRWSAFHRTSLLPWLFAQDVTSVVIAGCNLPCCPRATAFDASAHDLRAAVVTDAVSQATPQRLQDLALIGVQRHSVEQVRAGLATPSTRVGPVTPGG